MFYRSFLRPLLYLLPAETAHRLVLAGLTMLSRVPGGLWLLRLARGAVPAGLEVRALGLELPSPIGLAAGLDKDAEAFAAFGALGFGFVEVGTVTAKAQRGNPRPRLFRLVSDRSLINRMGFNNDGAERVAERLRLRSPGAPVVGVNIGKTKVTPAERALDDYAASARLLGPHADYVVVNVSSPNTPGLRDLQAVGQLGPLVSGVRAALDQAVTTRRVPLLVKIAPDLADADVDAVADLALERGLDGIIATNTTISRDGLRTDPAEVEHCGAGGLSGPPLKARSLQVLRRLRARAGPGLTLVSVGGIETSGDVRERLAAGATLVQLYTGLIYEGPGLPGRIHRELTRTQP